MIYRYLSVKVVIVSLLFLVLCGGARSQEIILHLRNGDRIAGVITSETTNEVTLTNSWAKDLKVPLAQIERRETPPPLAPLVPAMTPPPALPTDHPAPIEKKVTAALANTNSWWHLWKGELEVGMDVERGASDNQLYHGKATLAYAQPYTSDAKQFFRNIFTYSAEYGKTAGTVTDNRMNGSSKTDFDLTRLVYLYNLGSAGYDEIQKINLRYEEGPGAGYHWIRQTNFLVNLELGANYQLENRSDDTSTSDAYFRIAEDLTWKINKQMALTEKFEFSPQVTDPAQYRMRFESTLSYALLLNISLNFSVVDLYDTRPATAVPNNDLQIRTSLGVKF